MASSRRITAPDPAGGRLLLYTNSYDGTSDLVVDRLGTENVFRLNFDLWRDYRIEITPDGFEICNPLGRSLRLEDVSKVYWRKPAPTLEIFPERGLSPEDCYMEGELWYALRDLVNLLWQKGRLTLVEPFAEHRIGKLVQMNVARKFFEVPAWKFTRGNPWGEKEAEPAVVKSLTLNRVADRSVIYATKIAPQELDPGAPWFLQDYVEAVADVTVVFVRGELFAFELERNFTARSIDWREVSLEPDAPPWRPHVLPERIATAVRDYMAMLSLHYGRLDFLLGASGRYAFLEVNPHGEWGWLDPHGEGGVLEAILRTVSPATPLHPLPVTPAFSMPA
jgi:hypothetical protein